MHDNDDCPERRQVRALERKLSALLERSKLGAVDRSNTLIMFAFIELLEEHDHDDAKRLLLELARQHFHKLDASDLAAAHLH